MSDAQVDLWMTAHPEFFSAAGFMAGFIILAVILAIVIAVFSFIGTVRFARTGHISEAFNFSEICAQICRIGWDQICFRSCDHRNHQGPLWDDHECLLVDPGHWQPDWNSGDVLFVCPVHRIYKPVRGAHL